MKTRKMLLAGLVALLFAGSASVNAMTPSRNEIAIETVNMMVDEINGSLAQKDFDKDNIDVKARHQGRHVTIYVDLNDKKINFDDMSKAQKDAITKDVEQSFLSEIMSGDDAAQLRSLHRHYGITFSTVVKDAYGHTISHQLS